MTLRGAGASAAVDTTALGIGSVANGAFAYAYTVVGLRAYGPEAFAPIALVWSMWALAVAATTFPIQHWVNWRGESDGGLGRVRATMPALAGYVAAAAAITAGLLWSSIPALRTDPTWIALAAVLVVGSATLGWGRGMLAAQGEYRSVAMIIAGENLVRFVAAAIVVMAGGGIVAFGWTLAIGPLILLPVYRRLRISDRGEPAPFLVALGGLTVAVVVAQGFVQLGPVATEWLDGTDEQISAVFATFALLRAPVLVALGAVTRLTTPLTAAEERPNPAQLGRLLRTVTMAAVGGGAVAYAVGVTVGPDIVRFLFGDGTAIGDVATGATALGMWLAVIALVLLVLHIASSSTPQALVIWGGAGVLAIVVALAADDPVAGVTSGFVVGEVAAVAGSIAAHTVRYRRRLRTWRSDAERAGQGLHDPE